MGNEDFSIVIQVPSLVGIPGKVWGHMPEYQGWVKMMDMGHGQYQIVDIGPDHWVADTRSWLRLCQTQH